MTLHEQIERAWSDICAFHSTFDSPSGLGSSPDQLFSLSFLRRIVGWSSPNLPRDQKFRSLRDFGISLFRKQKYFAEKLEKNQLWEILLSLSLSLSLFLSLKLNEIKEKSVKRRVEITVSNDSFSISSVSIVLTRKTRQSLEIRRITREQDRRGTVPRKWNFYSIRFYRFTPSANGLDSR